VSSNRSSDVKLEIGHVLFIDIVGYSKLLINEQSEQINKLKQIVRGTEQVRLAEAGGKLLRLPTGDGGALVFRTIPEAPVLCAMEIAMELKPHPELKLRMGIHSGPVNEITDLNEQANIAGAGINIAQRVMDCGDAGHILLSRHAAEDLEHYPQWRPFLHESAECEVKHGMRIGVVNFYGDGIGSSQLPKRFQHLKRRRAKARWAMIASALVLLGAIILVTLRLGTSRRGIQGHREGAPLSIQDKSIAVLPFENLSSDPNNAYFAEGMQDEILARLSKIADLKVISRTSTQKYKSTPANLREIANQLGVANIVEGSVQKAGDQVRVTVQLINALNDTHLWADIYDRKLTDIFTVESDIAKTIADTLQARLTGAEKEMIAAKPTTDTTAYELYLKGRVLWAKRSGDNIPRAIAFYEQVITRDPNYALAYSGLAEAYAVLPWYSGIAPGEAYAKAKVAALKALQLDDKLAEAHAALGLLLCINDLAMAGSVRELQRAIALNPNYATAHQWYGVQPLTALGRFDEAIAEGKRAIELDPLSLVNNADLGWILMEAGRYGEAISQLRKALEIDPTFYPAHYNLGVALQLKGDLGGAISEYMKAQELSDDLEIPVMLATAKAQSGDKSAAEQMLFSLEQRGKHHYGNGAYWRALLYLSLGNRDEAIRWLNQSVADPAGSDVVYIKVFPFLDPLRRDPRFDALVQKVVGPK
jgi:TolB-like protein/Flp pilus assembly protein TadD